MCHVAGVLNTHSEQTLWKRSENLMSGFSIILHLALLLGLHLFAVSWAKNQDGTICWLAPQ